MARAALPNTTLRPLSSVSEISRGDLAGFHFLCITLFISGSISFFFKKEKFVCFNMFSCYEFGLFSYRGSVFTPYGKKSHNVCSFLVIVMSYLITKGSFLV